MRTNTTRFLIRSIAATALVVALLLGAGASTALAEDDHPTSQCITVYS